MRTYAWQDPEDAGTHAVVNRGQRAPRTVDDVDRFLEWIDRNDTGSRNLPIRLVDVVARA